MYVRTYVYTYIQLRRAIAGCTGIVSRLKKGFGFPSPRRSGEEKDAVQEGPEDVAVEGLGFRTELYTGYLWNLLL